MRGLTFLLLFCAFNSAFSQTTAFSYQGRLSNEGAPANGPFDFRFRLYNAVSGGTQVGTTVTMSAIPVSNGLFQVALNFGETPFDGSALWLQPAVRSNGVGSFINLNPRIAIHSAPYAIRSLSAATVPSGAISAEMLAPGAVTSQITNGSISGAMLASNSISSAHLQKSYLGGSISYSTMGSPFGFATRLIDYPVTFSQPFDSVPVITLSIDSGHPALFEKGNLLITARSTNGFTYRALMAPVGVEIARMGSPDLRPSAAMVEGNPAVIGSIQQGNSIGLGYIRSLDQFGNQWGAPKLLETGYPGAAELRILDGRPAVVFPAFLGGISFTRANDPLGDSWPVSSQIVTASEGSIFQFTAELVSSNLAIAFVRQDTNLFYLRANDPQGTSWGTPTLIYRAPGPIGNIDLNVIAGRPAIALHTSQSIVFLAGEDSNGSSWSAPQVAASDPNPSSPWDGPAGFVQLLNLNNFPYIIYDYVMGVNNTERYMASTLGSGLESSIWSQRASLSPQKEFFSASAAVIGDAPVIANIHNGMIQYYRGDRFASFYAPEGSLESAFGKLSIHEVSGEPAIFFYSHNALRILRRNTTPPNSFVNWIAVEP